MATYLATYARLAMTMARHVPDPRHDIHIVESDETCLPRCGVSDGQSRRPDVLGIEQVLGNSRSITSLVP